MDSVMGFTRKLAQFVVQSEHVKIPAWAFEHAKVAFLDWLAVTFGGKNEPLVLKLINYADLMGGNRQASVIGHQMKTSVNHAAMINGSASHALDYDDTLVSFLGHPSVTLFPGLLALAEWKEKSGRDFLAAYLIGLQVGGTIGACAGLDHYMSGWHATSTIGHLASAAGCSCLLGLDEMQTIYALGISGTQSSGLKRVFGTMCKPLHAGIASQSGMTSALLAQSGFTCAEDIIEGPQGFFEVLKGKVNKDIISILGTGWDIQNLSQKYHASCHATHSPIEAAKRVVKEHGIGLTTIKHINVHSSDIALNIAGKSDPETGLEGKFSIRYCVANAILRGQTGMQAFTDEKVGDPSIRAFMGKVHVIHDPEMKALEAIVEVQTTDGKIFKIFSDILQQIPPLSEKRDRVRNKFMDLCGPVLGEEKARRLDEAVCSLYEADNVRLIVEEFLS